MKWLVWVGMILVYCFSVNGQSLEELKKQKALSEKEISFTNELIDKTRERKQSTLQELLILNHRIDSRNKLIQGINAEIEILNEELLSVKDTISALEKRIAVLKDEYAEILKDFYKHYHHHNYVVFLFAAKSFNQGYRRLQHIKEYIEYRKRQKAAIIENRAELIEKMKLMDETLQNKRRLLDDKRRENEVLRNEKVNQNKLLASLKKKEKSLQQKLEEQRKTAERLQNEIELFLKRELAAQGREEGKRYRLTPEEKLISDDFSQNQGGLPWPTERGIITGRFGEHPHPVLKGIKVVNNGIDITTEQDATVRAVFRGEVKAVTSIPGANKIIIIRHGEYLSVYSNLRSVHVDIGDKVDTKQAIGFVNNNKEEGNAVLHLEIWKENKKLNPSFWLHTN